MQNLKSGFSRIFFPVWSIPLVLLAVLILTFGMFIPWLGYGYDEWHFVYYATRGSEGLLELFDYDGHPQSVWSYIISFKVLGYEPLIWQIYSLFWRWLAVSVFWLCFHLTWPKKQLQTFAAALVFAIYPFFTLQILPISYFEVWLSFFLLGLSFIFSMLAVRHPDRFGLFTTLAILFKVGHIFTSEYTWFGEVMRPALFWFALPGGLPFGKKLRQVALLWLPYFLIFFAAVFWRGFLYVPTRKTFQVQDGLLSQPLAFLAGWLLNVIPDGVLVLFTSWYPIFQPRNFLLTDRFNLILLIMSVLTAGSLFVYLEKILSVGDDLFQEKNWAGQAILTGLVAILFGVLPFYIAGYTIFLSKDPINSRFALGFLPGAALVIVGLLELLVASRRTRLGLLALLVAFSMTWHLRYTYDVRGLWAAQSEFFRQLVWRAPSLRPGTVLYEVQPFVDAPNSPARVLMTGDFSYSMALNALYQVGPHDEKLSYWYHSGGFEGINSDEPFVATHATTTFSGIPGRNLYFYFAPQQGECLRILQPADVDYRPYPDPVRAAAERASLDAIKPSLPANTDLINTVLDVDSGEGRWCYYYQKAELARQFADWAEAVALWKQAAERGLRPRHGMELLPFIEAHARSGDVETALALTQRANQISKAMSSPLCSLWRGLTQDLDDGLTVFEQVRDEYGCDP